MGHLIQTSIRIGHYYFQFMPLVICYHWNCWRKFVLACRRLCSVFITVNNAKVADRLLIEFCKKFEQLYGQDFVTPNMAICMIVY
jgi:hypothetical protein